MSVDKNGVVSMTSGFGCYKSFKGDDNFDKFYIDRIVKQVIHKTGDGDEDYILVDKVIETKRDIAQEIHKQADLAGIDAYMAPYEIAGEPLPDVKVSDHVQDFTQMPNNLADAALFGERALNAFKSLPADVIKGMSYEEFMQTFTQEKFDAYVESLKVKETGSVQKKEGE